MSGSTAAPKARGRPPPRVPPRSAPEPKLTSREGAYLARQKLGLVSLALTRAYALSIAMLCMVFFSAVPLPHEDLYFHLHHHVQTALVFSAAGVSSVGTVKLILDAYAA